MFIEEMAFMKLQTKCLFSKKECYCLSKTLQRCCYWNPPAFWHICGCILHMGHSWAPLLKPKMAHWTPFGTRVKLCSWRTTTCRV